MDNDATAADAQRLLDELARLDATTDYPLPSLSPPPPPPPSPPPDEVDILLADLFPRSPTAQFFTFFASDGDAVGPGDELQGFDLRSLPDGEQLIETPTLSAVSEPRKAKKVQRRPPSYNSNRARDQRRHEIAYLRRKVADMESELAQARALTGLDTKLALTGLATRSIQAHHQGRTRGGIWEQVAGRQREERQRAERENFKLRTQLELQLKVAKSLELILNKPALNKSLDEIGRNKVVASHAFIETTIDASDRALLQKLLEHVEQIYAQTDVMVRDGAAPASAGVHSASKDSLAEIFVTDLMPFSLSAVSKAAWSYFSHKKNYLPVPSRLYYERHDVDNVSVEDTVVESSGMERVANGLIVTAKIKQVLRRYVERDRVVIAWSAISQSVEINGQPFTSCDLREWGCMVLRPANASERREMDDALAPLTVLRSCYFIVPEFRGDGDFVTTQHDIGQLTECVLAFTTGGMSLWRQRIENILLDEQLAASRQ